MRPAPPLPPEAAGWTRGQRLQRIAHDRGMTLEALAGASGVARSTVYRIATGRSTGTLATWARMAEALGVPLGELMAQACG